MESYNHINRREGSMERACPKGEREDISMISEKMKPLVNNNSAIRAMFEEGKKLAAVYGAENVYDFSQPQCACAGFRRTGDL